MDEQFSATAQVFFFFTRQMVLLSFQLVFWQTDLISYEPTIITCVGNERLARALIPLIPVFQNLLDGSCPKGCSRILQGNYFNLPSWLSADDAYYVGTGRCVREGITWLAKQFRALYWVEIQYVCVWHPGQKPGQKPDNALRNSLCVTQEGFIQINLLFTSKTIVNFQYRFSFLA